MLSLVLTLLWLVLWPVQASRVLCPLPLRPRKSYMRKEKSARSAISANPCGILNNEHHIMHDFWVGPIASYLSQLFLLKRISL